MPFAVVIAGALLGRLLYHERYLIVVTPAYFALAGSGLACLSQRLATRLLAGIALRTLGVMTLTAYYQPATPLKPDFRATVDRIEAEAIAKAIIVMPAPQGPIVTCYLEDRLPTYTASEDDSPDGGHHPTLDWVLGEDVLDRIDVPPTLAAGEYRLVAGLYQADTGQRARVTAPTASDNRIELGPVTISAH